ncbi:proteasome subunit beta [Pseudomonas fluorescens group sp. PF-69]
MTTIAYKDGIIAYDGRITRGNQIVYDDFDKCLERDGVQFVCSGGISDFDKIVSAYFGGEVSDCSAVALIVVDGAVWHSAVDENTGFWKSPLMLDKPYALGSGTEHALTAMDMGASAYQAVEMAMKRDSCTGGKIRTLTVKVEQ